MRKPISDEKRAQVVAAVQSGRSYRDVAAEHNISLSTVAGIAKDAGVTSDRAAQTAEAAATKRATAAERRAQLQLDLLDDAARLRAQLWQPTTLHSFGGKDNTHNSIDLDEPLFIDKKNIIAAVSGAVARAIDLARLDAEQGGGQQARGLLARLVDSLDEHRKRRTQPEPVTPAD